ncbi:hypothetical protein [Acuticoccus sp.]|uniref:hypothetical protein n=1 Tax=Acuticoccus sp. TaxID=1904378 RepID=UPI003B52D7D8
MATFIVDTLIDESDGDFGAGDQSLREAIERANATSGFDTVTFAVSGTITLASEIAITDAINIDGNARPLFFAPITINGANQTRLFNVNADASFEGINFRNGFDATGEGGGAILHTNGDLVVAQSRFENNVVTGPGASGGAINAGGDVLSVLNTVFANNSATRAGGAIEASGGVQVLLDNANFSVNTAVGGADGPGDGGALHVTGGGAFVVSIGSNFSSNDAASEGGALWIDAGSFLNVRATDFDFNTARGDGAEQGGGAIYNNGGRLYVDGSSFFINNAATGASGSGGAILLNGGEAELYQSNLLYNTANRAGGAIEVTTGQLTVGLSDFVGNDAGAGAPAPGNGGAIHVTGAEGVDTAVTITDSRFNDNVASAEGGALWNAANSTMRVTATSIEQNFTRGADGGGGGIFNDGGDLVVEGTDITQNRAEGASGSGGGILTVGGSVRVSGTNMVGNEANRAGGAIEITDGSLQVDRALLQGNSAGRSDPAPGNGGAIHVSGNTAQTFITDSVVTNNFAANEGGGFWNGGPGAQMTVVNTAFTANNAAGSEADNGGGALYNNGGSLTVVDSTLLRNFAVGAAGSGGGILSAGGTLTVVDTVLRANFANRAGGGAEVIDGTAAAFERTTFTGNLVGAAPGNGGGVHAADPGTTVDLSDGAFEDNAANQGGGLWISADVTASVEDTTFVGNRAVGELGGGAIYVVDGGTLTVSESVIAFNEAATGEAISVAGPLPDAPGTIEIRNTEIGEAEVVGGSGADSLFASGSGSVIRGEAGPDTIRGSGGDDTIEGGDGDDSLAGGNNDDVIDAGRGDDEVAGNRGDDTLTGGAGNDTLSGSPGDDVINGGDGDDRLFGARNDDVLLGGRGSDSISGGQDRDTLDGGDGGDLLVGNNGDDVIEGGSGNDVALGGAGFDIVRGGAGKDSLDGGNGADEMFGDEGDDILFGGRGDDLIFGGEGDDTVIGSGGSDIFVVLDGEDGADADGTDTITDFQDGRDVIALFNGADFDDLAFAGEEVSLDGNVIAVVTGVDTTTLTVDDFIFA